MGVIEEIRVIAIDPGVDGAIAVMDGLHRDSVTILDLPTRIRHTGRTRVDGAALLGMLLELSRHKQMTYVGTEAIHAMPVTGSIGVFSQGNITGAIEAVIDILQIDRPWVQTRHINPYEWKKHYGLIKTKKEDSRQKALALFNNPIALRRKADHNRAEAALMALYLAHQVQQSLDAEVASD